MGAYINSDITHAINCELKVPSYWDFRVTELSGKDKDKGYKLTRPDYDENCTDEVVIWVDGTGDTIELPEDCTGLFSNCTMMIGIDTRHFDWGNVKYMTGMFEFTSLEYFSIEGKNLDTCKVKAMDSMFSYCDYLDYVSLRGLNVTHVTNINRLFCYCIALLNFNLPKTGFNNLKKARGMLSNCGYLENGDLGNIRLDNLEITTAEDVLDYMDKFIYLPAIGDIEDVYEHLKYEIGLYEEIVIQVLRLLILHYNEVLEEYNKNSKYEVSNVDILEGEEEYTKNLSKLHLLGDTTLYKHNGKVLAIKVGRTDYRIVVQGYNTDKANSIIKNLKDNNIMKNIIEQLVNYIVTNKTCDNMNIWNNYKIYIDDTYC